MATRYPVAYLRRSQADVGSPGDVSREAQETAVHALAHRDGHNGDLMIFTDWSKSAAEKKSSARTQYAAMVARIEAGEVSDVYAFSLDRLNRSLILSARFARACEDNGVRIVTQREGEVRQDSPAEWLRWTILATFGEYDLRTIQARAASTRVVRLQRGDHIGRVGYGFMLERNADGAIVAVPDPAHPLEPVVSAVREAGTILGGAKLLQARGIPSPDGRHVWGSTTLRRIVERAAPELIPTVGPSGRRQPSRSSALAQLLLCHCGHPMTPEPSRKSYRCRMGVRLGREAHGLSFVSEAAVMPWVVERAERVYQTIRDREGDLVKQDRANDTERAKLAVRRERVMDSFYETGDKVERDRALARIDAALAAIVDVPALIGLPPAIDWSWSASDINGVLKSMFVAIQLDTNMTPLSAESRLPAEYAA